ncbi:hypothetical protein O7635_19745 [Asanoa sp. WMMD1127]|uniref:hypothetical protein n=1 Tax=Asanoa sp. WMMD1127 TaxID=3016107 RepID=UPI0024172BE3|nr:hypothetical protein [Asanoa sp. WMMD1127]MDG4824092.1 hypothetical protein [Asanoa sp. WMMD1127]
MRTAPRITQTRVQRGSAPNRDLFVGFEFLGFEFLGFEPDSSGGISVLPVAY